jgi:murein DD-endopeptidase MepM/ murein hydrolase activator NlpD
MSSKAEKTSHRYHQQPRLSIFFRNPLLLKIVAWLSSLSFIGGTGVVWADLKPISTSPIEVAELIQSAAPVAAGTNTEDREVYGPYLPPAQQQSPVRVAPNSPLENLRKQLPNREVPIAVAPASAAILPTGTIVRPQHTDLLSADNHTVGVNGSDSEQKAAEEFINISVPAPLSNTIPAQVREIVTTTSSQVQASQIRPQSVVSQSVPTTSIQQKLRSEQLVPTVASIPTLKSISPRVGRTGASFSAANSPKATQRATISPQIIPLAGIKPTVVTPLKPAVAAGRSQLIQTLVSAPVNPEDSIEISVPAPRTRQIAVQAVAQLPPARFKAVPTVPVIPSVRPAGTGASQSTPIAFVNTGADQSSVELIYPLSSPAPTTSSFGWRTHPITGSRRFHSGVDIGASMGAPVVAAGSGMVISSGWLGGYGKAIVIQHNGVQQTLYGHLSEVFVQPGQRIEQGTVIGRVGSTGNSTGPHLHFETRVATTDGWVAVDPGDDIKYALDNLRRSAPFAQRDLPPGYN